VPGIRDFFTNNYWIGWVGQSNFAG